MLSGDGARTPLDVESVELTGEKGMFKNLIRNRNQLGLCVDFDFSASGVILARSREA